MHSPHEVLCARRTACRRATVWLAAIAAAGAIANPQNPQVVSGQAGFQTQGKQLTITNTPGAIIHWQSFGVDRGELTRFVQQNAASAVLNRITGTDPSRILGALQSNGRVFIINPNGIVFGAGAQVDVAGLVVSSLKLTDQDFLAGRLRFGDTPGAGTVRNEGSIRTVAGGQVVLVAPRVENSGLIEAPGGGILLAAGRSVEVADIDRLAIRVEISNTSEEAVNIGTLIAKNISIYGGLVRNSGTIQANSAVLGENGRVTLRGRQSVLLAPTSVIDARGPSGGEVLVQSDANATVHGSILARAELPVAPVAAALPTLAQPANPMPPVAPARQPAVVGGPAAPGPGLAIPDALVAPLATTAAPAQGAVEPPPTASPVAFPAATATAPAPLAALDGPASAVPARSATPTPADPLIPQRPAPLAPTQPLAPAPATPLAPASGNGIGGSVRVLGRTVTVGDNALLDASGPLGGGEILVGGGWQGLNPNIINAQFTYIAATAQLFASADLRGTGGLVVVWADNTAHIHGRIAARGGVLGGDGGYVETSGKRMLEVSQPADASAPSGRGGQWLLDPNNARIQTTGPDSNVTGSPPGTISTTGDSAIITVNTIKTALDNGINVTIVTSAGGSEAGDITVANSIITTPSSDATLTLTAHNNITVNSGVTISASGANKLHVTLNAAGSNAIAGTIGNNGGTLTLNGPTSVSGSLPSVGTLVAPSGLAISAGSVDVGGASTITGPVTLAGGTLGGTGALTLSGAFNVTGSSTLSGTRIS